MDMPDLEEEERLRIKKEQIEWRTKKNASSTFMLVSSLAQILMAVLLMVILTTIASLIVFNVLDLHGEAIQIVFPIMLMAIFVVSVVLNFVFYKKIARWAIKKFKLEDKLLDQVLDIYKVKNHDDLKSEIEKELKK